MPKTEKSNGIASHSPPEQAKRTSGSTPTLRRAGSIISSEDDRSMHRPPPTSRPRQLSAATASGHTASSFTRVRASSTTTDSSTALSNAFPNKHTLSDSTSAVSDQRPASGATARRKALPQQLDLNASRPSRARNVTRSRESLDPEDTMAGSDDDDMGELKPFASPKQRDRQPGFSTSTKELIAFLAEGPPELTSGENPPSFSTTPKKSGRLQKMISRITLASDTARPPRKMTVGSGDPSSKSMTNLSPLANRPVPPRYPTSGPSSATSSERGSADQAGTGTGAYPRPRAQSYVQKPFPACDDKSVEREAVTSSVPSLSPGMEGRPLGTTTPIPVISRRSLEIDVSQPVQPIKSPPSPTSPPAASVIALVDIEDATPIPAVQLPSSHPTAFQHIPYKAASPLRQKVAPPSTLQTSPPTPFILEHAREMRTMLEHATSAAECRILVDMFLARSKLVTDVADLRAFSVPSLPADSGVNGLEGALVELFLGDGELDSHHKLSFDPPSAEPAEPLFEAAVAPSASPVNRPVETSKPR